MALPKIEYPQFKCIIPSTSKDVWFRPYTHKEEKLLLIADESDDIEEINNITKQILSSCFSLDFDADELTSYDIEYMFLQLRIKSVSPTSDISYRVTECPDNDNNPCEKTINISINLEDVTLQSYDKETESFIDFVQKNKVLGGYDVKLAGGVGIIMKHPGLKEKKEFNKIQNATKDDLVKLCIVSVYDDNSVFTRDDFTDSELSDFYDDLISENKRKLHDFVDTIPFLRYEKTLSCKKCGFSENIVYEGLQSFFD